MIPIGTQGKKINRPPLAVLQRIFAKLKVKSDCWLWTGTTTSTGYGRISIDDTYVRVHRVVFAAFYGDIPKGFDVHHRCHERLCVNPEHVSLLPRGANVAESNYERSKHQYRSGDSTRLFDLGSGEEVEAVRCTACCGRGWQESENDQLHRGADTDSVRDGSGSKEADVPF